LTDSTSIEIVRNKKYELELGLRLGLELGLGLKLELVSRLGYR